MSKPLSVLDLLKQDIRYRDRIIIAFAVIATLMAAALVRMPSQISIYHPPDLSQKGQISKIGEVPPSTVYSFSVIFLERLMYCKDNCGDDYPATLNGVKTYLTPACFTQLKDHYQKNIGLYQNRTRSIQPLDNVGFDFHKVEQIDNKTWHVTEHFLLDERIRGTAIREIFMKYPMKIIKSNLTTALNPYQLQVDCFYADPTRISADDLEKIKK